MHSKSRITTSGLLLTGLLSVSPLPQPAHADEPIIYDLDDDPPANPPENPPSANAAGTESKVKALMVQHLSISADVIQMDANFADLGADSLAFVGLLLAIEQEFGFKIPDQETEKLVTVGALVAFIDQKTKK